MEILNKFILLMIVGAVLSCLDGHSKTEAVDVIEETAQVLEEIGTISK